MIIFGFFTSNLLPIVIRLAVKISKEPMPKTISHITSIGQAGALNNCQGPSGACDDSWYVFGCADTNAANWNVPITNNTDGASLTDDGGTRWRGSSLVDYTN